MYLNFYYRVEDEESDLAKEVVFTDARKKDEEWKN